MRSFTVIGLSAALAAALALAPAYSQENKPRRSVDPPPRTGPIFKQEEAPPELLQYERPGQYYPCITASQIKEIRPLSTSQILIRMGGKKAYVADVRNCPNLSRGVAIKYDATPNQLCNTTILHLLDPGSPSVQKGTCGVVRFEELEKKG